LLAATDNHVVGALVGTGLRALGREAPRRNRMTATGGTTLTTTMRVVDRVHGGTTNGRTDTFPTLGAGFAQRTQAVLGVRDFAQGRAALGQDLAHLAGAQTQGHVGTFTSDHLHGSAGGTCDLSTLARLQFDTVNGGT